MRGSPHRRRTAPSGAGDHEGRLLVRPGHPRGDRPGPEDPEPARRHRPDDLDRDLRLRPAPLRRLHPDDEARATSSATSSWARSSRSGTSVTNLQRRRPRRRAVPDRLRALLLLQEAALVALRQLQPQRLDGREDVRLLGGGPVRLLAHATAATPAARPSTSACRSPTSARSKIPRRPARRAGAVPLRHLPHRLHGRRELRHPARRHRRRLGLRAGRPVRDQERLPARRRAGDRHRPRPRPARGWRASDRQGRDASTSRTRRRLRGARRA